MKETSWENERGKEERTAKVEKNEEARECEGEKRKGERREPNGDC